MPPSQDSIASSAAKAPKRSSAREAAAASAAKKAKKSCKAGPTESEKARALEAAAKTAERPLPAGREALKAKAKEAKELREAKPSNRVKVTKKPAKMDPGFPKLRYGGGADKAYLQVLVEPNGKWASVMNITKAAIEKSDWCIEHHVDHKTFARRMLEHAIEACLFDAEKLQSLKLEWLSNGMPEADNDDNEYEPMAYADNGLEGLAV